MKSLAFYMSAALYYKLANKMPHRLLSACGYLLNSPHIPPASDIDHITGYLLVFSAVIINEPCWNVNIPILIFIHSYAIFVFLSTLESSDRHKSIPQHIQVLRKTHL